MLVWQVPTCPSSWIGALCCKVPRSPDSMTIFSQFLLHDNTCSSFLPSTSSRVRLARLLRADAEPVVHTYMIEVWTATSQPLGFRPSLLPRAAHYIFETQSQLTWGCGQSRTGPQGDLVYRFQWSTRSLSGKPESLCISFTLHYCNAGS